jgi:hypothetical protein
MKVIKVAGKIIAGIFLVFCFVAGSIIYMGYKRSVQIRNANSDISIWQKERDEIYLMEQAGFDGVVMNLSPGLHRHDVDTLTIRLDSWASADDSFAGNTHLLKLNDSTLLLFIAYSESLYKPNQIEVGDIINKPQFSFDFSIYNQQKQFRKKLSLLFCSYENPDTIITIGNFVFGTYGTYFYKKDTLFCGTMSGGKRQGSWKYFKAHENGYKIIEGQYSDDKRNGLFRKFYERTNQLMYEENYRDNLPDGQFTWWYSNGQVQSRKYFKNGKAVGVWEFFDNSRKLIKKVNCD